MTEKEFAILSSAKDIGGAETLMKRIISYLSKMRASISLISFEQRKSTLITKLDLRKVDEYIVPYEAVSDFFYLGISDGLKSVAREVIKNLHCTTFVMASYFGLLQQSMAMFREYPEIKILTGFFHTEAWVRNLFEIPSFARQPIRPIKRSPMYYYQKELLIRLNEGSANWFMSNLVKKYHEYYYDVELPNSHVIPIPFDIPEIDPVVLKRARKKSDILKVVWLGRFEYFKNPSIKKAYEALKQLIEKHKDLKVEFDLIGYGSEKYEKDIKKEVRTLGRLQVKYLGKIFPDRLSEVLAQYDVGVAMGTSALHIGVMGIPTIYVDASDEKHYREIKGCWLHKEAVGLGSGVYGDIAGFRIDGREDMRILFEEMIAAPNLFEDYGAKDRNYVIENYDENKIMPQIIDAWTSSTFSPGDMEVYRHPPLKRFIRRTAKKILRR